MSVVVYGRPGTRIEWWRVALGVYVVIAECSSGGMTMGRVQLLSLLWSGAPPISGSLDVVIVGRRIY